MCNFLMNYYLSLSLQVQVQFGNRDPRIRHFEFPWTNYEEYCLFIIFKVVVYAAKEVVVADRPKTTSASVFLGRPVVNTIRLAWSGGVAAPVRQHSTPGCSQFPGLPANGHWICRWHRQSAIQKAELGSPRGYFSGRRIEVDRYPVGIARWELGGIGDWQLGNMVISRQILWHFRDHEVNVKITAQWKR